MGDRATKIAARVRRVIAKTVTVTAVAALVLASRAGDGVAQEEAAPLAARLRTSGREVTASFDVSGAFTETFRKRLGGGLTSEVIVLMELVDSGGSSVARLERVCKLRLDIWDDVLFVGIFDGDRAPVRKKYVITDEALKACGVVSDIPIGERSLLTRPRGYRLVVRVALNPVDPEVLERTREFMANPRGAGGGGRPRAFFGAVAKLFRSDSTAGGERVIFQSQPLERP